MRVDTLTNYALDQYAQVPLNFPPEYNPENPARKSVSVFDKLSPGQPSNRRDQCLALKNRQQERPRLRVLNNPV